MKHHKKMFAQKYRHQVIYSLLITSICAPTLIMPWSVQASSLSAAQKSLYKQGVNYHDINGGLNACSANGTSSFAINRDVYILGDSYGSGYESLATKALNSKGFSDIKFNYSNGRSVSGPGSSKQKTSGLDAVAADKDIIANKGTIILELGTNPESNFKDNQERLLNLLRSINSTARLYWINVGNYDEIDDTNTNSTISSNANTFDYKVIDWKSIASKSYFKSDPVHPNDGKGWEEYSDLIANTVDAPPISSTGGGTATTGGFYATDASKSNPERIWQFATAPQGLGLNSTQAAGVLGNIRAEAGPGYGPDAKETGGTQAGRGIVQWTAGSRKENLKKFTDSNGSQFQDLLDLQLNFMKQELTTTYKKTLTLLKNTDANTLNSSMSINDPVVAATVVFHGTSDNFTVPGIPYGYGYEASGDSLTKVINVRGKQYAYEALRNYGGEDLTLGGSLELANGGCPETTMSVAGQGGWDLSGPNAIVVYEQGGDAPWTRESFHPFDSGVCGTLKECGCSAISAAIIISTLSSTKIDPGQLAAKYSNGASWSNVPTQYGLKKTDLGKDFSQAAKILESGGLVMIHILPGSTFAGHTWNSGHFFIVRKVENGKFYVYTLFGSITSAANTTAYSTSDFMSGGIDEMWGYLK